jgi:hypothetical protein
MKYIYILLFCIIGVYLIFKFNENYSTFENFDPSLVPVSSIITLAKITEKLIDIDGNLIFPANFTINKNVTVTGNATIEDDFIIGGNNNIAGQLNTQSGYETINGALYTPLIIGSGPSSSLNIYSPTVTVNDNITVNNNSSTIQIKGNTNFETGSSINVTDIVTINGQLNTNQINVTGTVTCNNNSPTSTTSGNLTGYNGTLNNVTANSIIAKSWNSGGDDNYTTFKYANDLPFLDTTGVKREIYETNGPTYFGAGTGSTGGWSFQSNSTKLLTIDKDGNADNINALVASGSATSLININNLNIKSGTVNALSITSRTSPSSTSSVTAEIGCDNLEFKNAGNGSCTVTIKGTLTAKTLTPSPLIYNIVPPGSIMLFCTTNNIPSPNSGWQLCDGSAIPSTSILYINNVFPDNKTPNMLYAATLYGGNGNNCGYKTGVYLTGSVGGTCQGSDEWLPVYSLYLPYIKI